MKRLVSLLVVLTMLFALFTGCKQKEAKIETNENQGTKKIAGYLNTESEFPIVKEKITLKVAVPKNPNSGPADEIWFWKWAEQTMNIKFDIQQIDTIAVNEKVNLMFAANELPDILYGNLIKSQDVVKYGQEEKLILSLNNLIEQYGPNIKKAFSENPEVKAKTTSIDGNIYALPGIQQDKTEFYSQRAWINRAWLENLGLKMPQTLDEFYTVLKAFKEKDPNRNGKQDEIPLSGSISQNPVSMIIYTALGFAIGSADGLRPVIKDGKIAIPAIDPLYAEYIKYMTRLFKEGLLDNDYFTNTTVQFRAKGSELRVGAHTDAAPFLSTPKNFKDYEALTPLTSQWNNKKIWPTWNDFNSNYLTVTNACKYPEAAVRFADFFFTDKGALYSWGGPQKGSPDTLGMIDGWYQDSEGILKYGSEVKIPNNEYINRYVSPTNLPHVGLIKHNQVIESITGKSQKFAENAAAWRESWDKNVRPYVVPTYPVEYMDINKSKRLQELLTNISDYVSVMEAKFMTGTEPLSGLDNYFNQIKKLGSDELLQIYQEAYDAYKKNLEK